MNLEELITLVFKKVNEDPSGKKYTKSEIRNMYKALIEVIEDRLEEETVDMENKKEVKVNIPLIGKFNIVRQNAYIGKNPKTKEKIKIEANNRIYFSPYKSIKKAVNK